ncbi:MAG: hypothetical protein MZV70_62865 [Desulfobacterales bacterium]|nr:hypothetical protein [Desulfobacterales bacterium]
MLRFFNSAGSEHFQYGAFSSDAEAPTRRLQQGCRRRVEHPGHAAGRRPDALRGQLRRQCGQHPADYGGLACAAGQEHDPPGPVQNRIGEGDPPHLRPAALYGSRPAQALLQGRAAGEQRRGVAVRAHPEDDQVKNRLGEAPHAKMRSQFLFVAPRQGLGVSRHRHGVDAGRPRCELFNEIRAGRPEVAVRVRIGHQALIRPEEVRPVPGDTRGIGVLGPKTVHAPGVDPPEIATERNPPPAAAERAVSSSTSAAACSAAPVSASTRMSMPVFMPVDRLHSRRRLPGIAAYQGGLIPCAPSGSIWG